MFNYFLYRIGQSLALFFPRPCAYWIAVCVSDIRYCFAARDRREVFDNLKAMFPDKSLSELKRIRINMFRNFAKYLVDFFCFTKLDTSYISRHIRHETITHFDKARAQGKGAIALTAHLGNWELGGAVIGLSGYPFWAVALPHKNTKVNDFFNVQRQRCGVHVISIGHAAKECLAALRKQSIVALVGDRDFTSTGRSVSFLGKTAVLPLGPAVLSVRTGAPIVAGFLIRNPDDSFTLHIEEPMFPIITGNTEKDVVDTMQRCVAIMERFIRKYPDQWYMFRRFWLNAGGDQP